VKRTGAGGTRASVHPRLWETAIVVEKRLKKQIHLQNRLMNVAHQEGYAGGAGGGAGMLISVLARSPEWSIPF
jgi:hypothetical protein